MELVLTEDQELLAKTATDFVRQHSPVSRIRALRDANDPTGFSRDLWKQMAELGWTGILVPDTYGGAGMGLADLAVVLEALGRTLAPEPFLSTVLLAGELLSSAGSDARNKPGFPDIASGEKILTVAYQESAQPLRPQSRHHESRATGAKLSALRRKNSRARWANRRCVHCFGSHCRRPTRREGSYALPRCQRHARTNDQPQHRVDNRAAALLALDSVKVGQDSIVGPLDGGCEILSQIVDRATVGLCAEMLGGMSQIFDDTIDYLKTRQQFGALIGTFQGLQHRAARLFMEIELARSSVMAAARAADADDPEWRSLVSLAKARCSDAYILAANEGVQMHGGIGMTDEHDAGFYLKRARAAEMTFGDAAWHRERWSQLHRY